MKKLNLMCNCKAIFPFSLFFILLVILAGDVQGFHPMEADQVAIDTYISEHFSEVKQISTEKLHDMLEGPVEKMPIIIDSRSRKEYEISHLKNAVHISKARKAYRFLKKQDTGRPVVVYCSVGIRSTKMVNRLNEAGFKNVYNLEGSIFKWANEGRPIYKGEKETDKVHPFDKKWGVLLYKHLWSITSD